MGGIFVSCRLLGEWQERLEMAAILVVMGASWMRQIRLCSWNE